MINCHICNNPIKKRDTYTIVEKRESPFPGVEDYMSSYYCKKCWKALGVDIEIKTLLARELVDNPQGGGE